MGLFAGRVFNYQQLYLSMPDLMLWLTLSAILGIAIGVARVVILVQHSMRVLSYRMAIGSLAFRQRIVPKYVRHVLAKGCPAAGLFIVEGIGFRYGRACLLLRELPKLSLLLPDESVYSVS